LTSSNSHSTLSVSNSNSTLITNNSAYHDQQQQRTRCSPDYKFILPRQLQQQQQDSRQPAAPADSQLPPRPPHRSSASASGSPSLVASPETTRRPDLVLRPQEISRKLESLVDHSDPVWLGDLHSVQSKGLHSSGACWPQVTEQKKSVRPLFHPGGQTRPPGLQQPLLSSSHSREVPHPPANGAQRTEIRMFIQGKQAACYIRVSGVNSPILDSPPLTVSHPKNTSIIMTSYRSLVTFWFSSLAV
jgi:hypothetical protein